MVSGRFFRLRPFRSPDNLENEGRQSAKSGQYGLNSTVHFNDSKRLG